MSVPGVRTSRSKTVASPDVGSSRPRRILSSVLLPAPFEPTSPTIPRLDVDRQPVERGDRRPVALRQGPEGDRGPPPKGTRAKRRRGDHARAARRRGPSGATRRRSPQRSAASRATRASVPSSRCLTMRAVAIDRPCSAANGTGQRPGRRERRPHPPGRRAARPAVPTRRSRRAAGRRSATSRSASRRPRSPRRGRPARRRGARCRPRRRRRPRRSPAARRAARGRPR